MHGSENNNGSKLGVAGKTSVQAMTLLASELIGSGVEMAALAHMDKAEKALPGPFNAVKSFIKGVIVKPFLKPIEHVLNYTKGIEGAEAYQQRMRKSDDERAEGIADATLRYGASTGVGYGTMYAANKVLGQALNTPVKHAGKLLLVDAAVHLGSIAMMSMPFMANTTEKLRDAATCVFKSCGMDDAKAHDMAKYAIAVQLPNYIAYSGQVATLLRDNMKAAAAVPVRA